MATSQDVEMGREVDCPRWCSSNTARRSCNPLPLLPSPWGQSSRRLGEGTRSPKVCKLEFISGLVKANLCLRYLYMTIVCMDANFRLKNNLVSNYSQDPGLGTGWAYMVARAGYEKYVLSHASDDDVRRHSSYSSVLH